MNMEFTKIVYYIDDEETPYLMKLSVPPEKITLGHLKEALNKPNYKIFFKSVDIDFGVVKEELSDINANLPSIGGHVVAWLVTKETSDNDQQSHASTPTNLKKSSLPKHGSSNVQIQTDSSTSSRGGNCKSESLNENTGSSQNAATNAPVNQSKINLCDGDAEDGLMSGDQVGPLKNFHDSRLGNRSSIRRSRDGHRPVYIGGASESNASHKTTDIESTSFFDSDADSSRFSTVTGTSASSIHYSRQRKQKRRRRFPVMSRASTFSSMTDSTMSLDIVTVTLNLETANFLGISIVGQSNKNGDGGIYVGSIMKGGAVAQDGRIEPGDMILEVNNISFENMSNDEAVLTLREQVQKPGLITLVVAKCWQSGCNPPAILPSVAEAPVFHEQPSPAHYQSQQHNTAAPLSTLTASNLNAAGGMPLVEPVRPIDPRAWVLHTNAALGQLPLNTNSFMSQSGPTRHPYPCATTHMQQGDNSSSPSSIHEPDGIPGVSRLEKSPFGSSSHAGYLRTGTLGGFSGTKSVLSVNDMVSVVRAMAQSDSGLVLRDRMWLKITIPNAFIGSDLIDWLINHVDGLSDRKEARKYAESLLKCGYIRHTVNKSHFSEQCYYIFGDLTTLLSHMNLNHFESSQPHIVSNSRSQSPCPWIIPPGISGNSTPLSQNLNVPPPAYPPSLWNDVATISPSLGLHTQKQLIPNSTMAQDSNEQNRLMLSSQMQSSSPNPGSVRHPTMNETIYQPSQNYLNVSAPLSPANALALRGGIDHLTGGQGVASTHSMSAVPMTNCMCISATFKAVRNLVGNEKTPPSIKSRPSLRTLPPSTIDDESSSFVPPKGSLYPISSSITSTSGPVVQFALDTNLDAGMSSHHNNSDSKQLTSFANTGNTFINGNPSIFPTSHYARSLRCSTPMVPTAQLVGAKTNNSGNSDSPGNNNSSSISSFRESGPSTNNFLSITKMTNQLSRLPETDTEVTSPSGLDEPSTREDVWHQCKMPTNQVKPKMQSDSNYSESVDDSESERS